MSDARAPLFDFDVTKMFADFRFRPFDVEAVWAAQRRNLEALSQANQLAVEGVHALAKRQIEMTQQTLEEVSTHVREMVQRLGLGGADSALAVAQAETADKQALVSRPTAIAPGRPPSEAADAGGIARWLTRRRVLGASAGAAVAQPVEQRIRNAWVGGSNPLRGTNHFIVHPAASPLHFACE